MLKILAPVFALFVLGCATNPGDPSDAEAETDPGVATGKGDDASALFGNYDLNQILNGNPQNADGDIVSLSLFAELDGSRPSPALGTAGSFVRVRAYHGGRELVAQTDTFRLFTTSSGKHYIEFRGFSWTDFANNDQKSVVEDVYEYKLVSSGLQLRKTFTDRLQGLEAVSDQTVCTNSGGTWDPAHPVAGARAESTTPCNCAGGKTFVPGASGCMIPIDAGESSCDDSQGEYTDDDSTLLGNFCVCPTAHEMTTTGCVGL